MPAREMPKYETGLQELGDNLYAYLQWDGGWGISNAGFVDGGDGLLVIDALMAPSMTRAFVDAMRGVSAAPFRQLVNTHSHADHTNGNQFIEGAEIVAHENCLREMEQAAAARAARPPGDRGPRPAWIQDSWWEELAEVDPPLPTDTFSGDRTLRYGDTEVQLLHWGPAHTTGDVMLYFPASKLLFAGDLAFFYATPLCRGDMANWVRIIDRLDDDLDVERVIPGHGPPGGLTELADQREYLDFMLTKTRAAFDDGLTEEQAAAAIDLGQWGTWPESERKEMNIATLYRTFANEG
ncbi:MAG: MBL fold metallo-hydrolase [Dehalococcoidia bacterium]